MQQTILLGLQQNSITPAQEVLQIFDQYIESFPLSIKEHIHQLEFKLCKDKNSKYEKIPQILYKEYFRKPHSKFLTLYTKFLHNILQSNYNNYIESLPKDMRQYFLNETFLLNTLDTNKLSSLYVEFATYIKQNNNMQSLSNSNKYYKANNTNVSEWAKKELTVFKEQQKSNIDDDRFNKMVQQVLEIYMEEQQNITTNQPIESLQSVNQETKYLK